MGNSQSSTSANDILQQPALPSRRTGSPSRSGSSLSHTDSTKLHKPTRRRSIDLPDLAMLDEEERGSPSPTINGTKTSSIPIPIGEDRASRKVNRADYAVQPSAHMEQVGRRRAAAAATAVAGGTSAVMGNTHPVLPMTTATPLRGRAPGIRTHESSSRLSSRARAGSQYLHYINSTNSLAGMRSAQRSRVSSFAIPPPPEPSEISASPEQHETVDDDSNDVGPKIVRSSIPLGLSALEDLLAEGDGSAVGDCDAKVIVQEVDLVTGVNGAADEVQVKISWLGEGHDVWLVLESGNSWDDRRKMELDTSPQFPASFQPSSVVSPPDSGPVSPPSPTNILSTVVSLRKGTHHLRFLVDDEWRLADNLPTAVDSTGLSDSLANYLNVGILAHPADKSSRPRLGLTTTAKATSGPSSSSLNGQITPSTTVASNGTQIPPRPGRRMSSSGNTHVHPAAAHFGRTHQNKGLGLGYSFWSSSSNNDMDGTDTEASVYERKEHRRSLPPLQPKMTLSKYTPEWSTEIPLELIEAAEEEENFLQHQQEMQQQMAAQRRNHQTQYANGFIPLPNIPPAPVVPGYLQNQILNARPHHHASRNEQGRKRERDRHREKDKRPRPPSMSHLLPVTTASGTDVTAATSRSHNNHRHSHSSNPHHNGHRSNHHHTHQQPSPDREAPPPPFSNNHPPVTAATAVAISAAIPGTNHPLHLSADDTKLITDDSSILPQPSHVVLHHLSTGAIKNGTLGVAQTGRYRAKYVTTVYYKPTE